MPGRPISMQAKLAVLATIQEKKNILFGRFGNRMNDGNAKAEAWKEVRLKAIEVGAAALDRDWMFVRDKLWGVWKSKALEKNDNSRQTGAGDGRPNMMSEVDEKILEIIGNNSAAVVGLNIPQTGDSSSSTADADSGSDNEVPRCRTNGQTTRAPQLRRKRNLQIETLELQKKDLEMKMYERSLRMLALERQLNVVRSPFTQEIERTPPQVHMEYAGEDEPTLQHYIDGNPILLNVGQANHDVTINAEAIS